MEGKSEFEEFIKKYCVKHEITPEEAKKHKLVKEVESYYADKEKDKV